MDPQVVSVAHRQMIVLQLHSPASSLQLCPGISNNIICVISARQMAECAAMFFSGYYSCTTAMFCTTTGPTPSKVIQQNMNSKLTSNMGNVLFRFFPHLPTATWHLPTKPAFICVLFTLSLYLTISLVYKWCSLLSNLPPTQSHVDSRWLYLINN